MKRLLIALSLVALTACHNPKHFTSVTISPIPASPYNKFGSKVVETSKTNVVLDNATLWEVLEEIYPERPWTRIVAARKFYPALLGTRFNIQAALPINSIASDFPEMFNTMLEQKFGLKSSNERQLVSILEIKQFHNSIVETKTPFIRVSQAYPLKKTRVMGPKTFWHFDMACTFPQLAAFLQDALKIDVVDKTGLEGIYHFTFVVPTFKGFDPEDNVHNEGGPSLSTYQGKRLGQWRKGMMESGLDLVAAKRWLPITVIHSIEAQPKP